LCCFSMFPPGSYMVDTQDHGFATWLWRMIFRVLLFIVISLETKLKGKIVLLFRYVNVYQFLWLNNKHQTKARLVQTSGFLLLASLSFLSYLHFLWGVLYLIIVCNNFKHAFLSKRFANDLLYVVIFILQLSHSVYIQISENDETQIILTDL
jgi:hypothetical protein